MSKEKIFPEFDEKKHILADETLIWFDQSKPPMQISSPSLLNNHMDDEKVLIPGKPGFRIRVMTNGDHLYMTDEDFNKFIDGEREKLNNEIAMSEEIPNLVRDISAELEQAETRDSLRLNAARREGAQRMLRVIINNRDVIPDDYLSKSDMFWKEWEKESS